MIQAYLRSIEKVVHKHIPDQTVQKPRTGKTPGTGVLISDMAKCKAVYAKIQEILYNVESQNKLACISFFLIFRFNALADVSSIMPFSAKNHQSHCRYIYSFYSYSLTWLCNRSLPPHGLVPMLRMGTHHVRSNGNRHIGA